jgi:putative tryptophan/tyrosine transport system substrate-binding protein
MQRREFITLIGGAAAVWPVTVRAQRSGRLPVVGGLWGSAEAAASYRLPFLKGLAGLGHEPGKTFILEERYANEVPERFDALATELILIMRGDNTSLRLARMSGSCWRRKRSP